MNLLTRPSIGLIFYIIAYTAVEMSQVSVYGEFKTLLEKLMTCHDRQVVVDVVRHVNSVPDPTTKYLLFFLHIVHEGHDGVDGLLAKIFGRTQRKSVNL